MGTIPTKRTGYTSGRGTKPLRWRGAAAGVCEGVSQKTRIGHSGRGVLAAGPGHRNTDGARRRPVVRGTHRRGDRAPAEDRPARRRYPDLGKRLRRGIRFPDRADERPCFTFLSFTADRFGGGARMTSIPQTNSTIPTWKLTGLMIRNQWGAFTLFFLFSLLIFAEQLAPGLIVK